MTVKQLREHLTQFPDNTRIVYSCCSDYVFMDSDDVTLGKAVSKLGQDWVMYKHPSYQLQQGEEIQEFVFFPGN